MGRLIASEVLTGSSGHYEITPDGRTLVMSVADKNALDVRKTPLTSVDLLRFFPEKDRIVSAYENEGEVVVAVVLARHLFVYGKDWNDPEGFKFRFLGQWLDKDGKSLGNVTSFRHANPALSPTVRLVTQMPGGMKVSRKSGFGFICYDITEQTPVEARFLKLKVLKERVSPSPITDVPVSNFHFLMELPAAE